MKRIFIFYVLALVPVIVVAQDFNFKCTYKNTRLPFLYVVPQNNILQNALYHQVPLIKDSDSSLHVTLRPSGINFFKIGFDQVLVSPGDHTEGYFNGSAFEPKDSNSINFTLTRIARGFSDIVNLYHIGSDFPKFKSVVGLLNKYIDSTNNTLNIKEKPWLNKDIIFALQEYLSARLAHFLVLPILFKNNYDHKELAAIIRRNIHIRYPKYWLQIESTRIFLQTYYRKISLPNADYNLQKSLKDKFFMEPAIRKLETYNYFLECMEKAFVKTKSQLSDDWTKSKTTQTFSNPEQTVMKEVYAQIQKIGKNIADVFSTLPLMNGEGKMLNTAEKESLISRKNIILDFWASWCEPCKERMKKLNSDHITLGDQPYRIIYLSLDQDQNKWKGASFSFLNKANSYRITGPDNLFVKEFNINVIPRYMIINNGGLISAAFSFD